MALASKVTHAVGWGESYEETFAVSTCSAVVEVCMRVTDSQNIASSTSLGKIGIIEDSEGQLHRKQVFYAMHRGCYLAEHEEKGFSLLLGGERIFLSREQCMKGCRLLLWRDIS